MIVKLCIIVINDNAIYCLNLEIKKTFKKRFCFVCVILFMYLLFTSLYFFSFMGFSVFSVSVLSLTLPCLQIWSFWNWWIYSKHSIWDHYELTLNCYYMMTYLWICSLFIFIFIYVTFSFNTLLLKVYYR